MKVQASTYQSNRRRLESVLPNNCIAIIQGASEVERNGGVFFQFHQYPNFYYLTGFKEPDAVLIILKQMGKSQSIIFTKGCDESKKGWETPMLSHKEVSQRYLFDSCFPLEGLESWLSQKIIKDMIIYRDSNAAKKIKVKEYLEEESDNFFDLDKVLMPLRMQKTPYEIGCMKKAAQITVNAHKEAIKSVKKFGYTHEYQVAAMFEYQCRLHSSEDLAYPSIVAQGANACILHYRENKSKLEDGNCILMDAGAEYRNYCADVSRTWPISGKFTVEQKLIYESVLEAQKQCISMLKPGVVMKDVHLKSVEVLSQCLIDIGLLQGSLEHCLEESLFKKYYWHSVGHSIGLDVHDPSYILGDWVLQENMVVTIEPGLYIGQGTSNLGPGFENIGVRIEDDILISKEGCENLSVGFATDVDSIERLSKGEDVC